MAAKLHAKNRTRCFAISDTTVIQRDSDGNETLVATIPRRKSRTGAKAATKQYAAPVDKTPKLTPEREAILRDLEALRARTTYDEAHREVY